MCRLSFLIWVILAMVTMISVHDIDAEVFAPPQNRDVEKFSSYETDEEYIRHIHSMINAYRSDMLGGRLIIETNALIDTKYRTWKRSADLINSLLALPKGMNDAGR